MRERSSGDALRQRPEVELRSLGRTSRPNKDSECVRSERTWEQAIVYAYHINRLFQARRKSFMLDAQYARTIKTVPLADIVYAGDKAFADKGSQ